MTINTSFPSRRLAYVSFYVQISKNISHRQKNAAKVRYVRDVRDLSKYVYHIRLSYIWERTTHKCTSDYALNRIL